MGPQAGVCLMNIFQRIQFARDRNVTAANLVDELVRRKGNCEVSVGDDGHFHLADLHADVRSIDAFLRRAIALQPGQPVAIYRTNTPEASRFR
jgi:long-chain acyl-CoA synthetase